jgi:hypothetical protein
MVQDCLGTDSSSSCFPSNYFHKTPDKTYPTFTHYIPISASIYSVAFVYRPFKYCHSQQKRGHATRFTAPSTSDTMTRPRRGSGTSDGSGATAPEQVSKDEGRSIIQASSLLRVTDRCCSFV